MKRLTSEMVKKQMNLRLAFRAVDGCHPLNKSEHSNHSVYAP